MACRGVGMRYHGSKLILALESSCDDACAAIIGPRLHPLFSQRYSHRAPARIMGGVVPKLSAIHHSSFFRAIRPREKDTRFIAISKGPGIAECLSKSIEFSKWTNAPLKMGIHHIHAHLMMAIPRKFVLYPFVGIVLSGGHTLIVLCTRYKEYIIMASSYDENIGDTIEKVLRQLPGSSGEHYFLLNRSLAMNGCIKQHVGALSRELPPSLDFSFSGLRSSFTSQEWLDCLAAAFSSIFKNVERALQTLKASCFEPRAIVGSGGVFAGDFPRHELNRVGSEHHIPVFIPPKRLCTDNALMIARAALFDIRNGKIDLDLARPLPCWPLNDIKADE
jgi:N6-L-threonylcarbamoyladenine synthase